MCGWTCYRQGAVEGNNFLVFNLTSPRNLRIYQESAMITASSTVVLPTFLYTSSNCFLRGTTAGWGCPSRVADLRRIASKMAFTYGNDAVLTLTRVFSGNSTSSSGSRKYSLTAGWLSHSFANPLVSTFGFLGTRSVPMAQRWLLPTTHNLEEKSPTAHICVFSCVSPWFIDLPMTPSHDTKIYKILELPISMGSLCHLDTRQDLASFEITAATLGENHCASQVRA